MLPIRHRSIFRSRWVALLWAAGIIYTAVQVATPNETAPANGADAVVTDATGAPVDEQQLKALEQAINGI